MRSKALTAAIDLITTVKPWAYLDDDLDVDEDNDELDEDGLKLGGSTVSSFAGFSEDGKSERYYNQACHYYVEYMKARDAFVSFDLRQQHLTTQTGYEQPPQEVRDRYLIWVFTQSPWAQVLAKEEGEHASLDFRLKFGIVIGNTGAVTAPMLMQLCIAHRISWEYGQHVEAWDKLVQAGVHPNVAFYWCRFAEKYRDTYTLTRTTDVGHWPVDFENRSTEYFENFVLGKVVNPGLYGSFKKEPTYRPCNSVWGSKINYRMDRTSEYYYVYDTNYRSFIEKTYDLKAKQKLTFEEVVALCKKEAQRVGLA